VRYHQNMDHPQGDDRDKLLLAAHEMYVAVQKDAPGTIVGLRDQTIVAYVPRREHLKKVPATWQGFTVEVVHTGPVLPCLA